MAVEDRSPRTAVVAAIAVVVALVVAAGSWAAARGGGGGSSDEVDVGGRVVVAQTRVGNGDLPDGITWTLDARREGVVCRTFAMRPGPPARERCTGTRGGRPFADFSVSLLRPQGKTLFVTVGQVSERVERVRVSPDGVEPWEVPTLGEGTGLEVRFFVTHTTSNVPVTFMALAADGSELARTTRPALRT